MSPVLGQLVADLPGHWQEAVRSGGPLRLDDGLADLAGLPEQLRAELAWLAHWQACDGAQVPQLALGRLVGALRWALATGRPVPASVTGWQPGDWDALLREHAYHLTGRLPASGLWWARATRLLDLPVVALQASMVEEWWQLDRWHMRCDPRIPRRAVEPHAEEVDWARLQCGWLRASGKRFAAQLLSSGEVTWSTLTGRIVPALAHFDRWLAEIADPAAAFGPEQLAQAPRHFTTWVADHAPRRRPSVREANYHLRWVGRLVDFAAVTPELADAPWGRATELQAAAWFKAVARVRNRVDFDDMHYIDDATLAQVVSYLHVLGGDPAETFTVVRGSGEQLSLQGMGQPQAMRMLLLQILTGRRASEICLAPLDCLSSPVSPEASAAGLAVFRYAQSKIDGAPDTILVDPEVVAVVEEQRRWLAERFPGRELPYLFVQLRDNSHGAKPCAHDTYAGMLRRFSQAVRLVDTHGHPLRLSHTHRFRHTKLTKLAELGLPIAVIQRYAGHATPTMSMFYVAKREEYQEQVFVATRKYRSDGEEVRFSREVYEAVQLFQRADRILPHGWCLLPPLQTCDKGNACLTCGVFVTDSTHLESLRRMLAETEALIDKERQRFSDRHGVPMPEDNVWLRERLIEREALYRLIAKVGAATGKAVEGGGADASSAVRPVEFRRREQP